MFEIIIKDLKLFGYHGVHEFEKTNGQYFLFNIRAKLENKNISKNIGLYKDDISGTVNYSEIINVVKDINLKNKFNLLETLSYEIAKKIFSSFGMIKYLEVCVEKINPPINEDIGSVGVKFKAARKDFFKELQNEKSQNADSQNTELQIIELQNEGLQNLESKNEGFHNEKLQNKEFQIGKSLNRGQVINFSMELSFKNCIYLSLGSNLGDRKENLKTAVNKLSKNKELAILKVSSIYETEPMYYEKQESFYNIVLKCTLKEGIKDKIFLTQKAFELLGYLKFIEFSMKRKQDSIRNGPRIIDIDIIYFYNLNLQSDILNLPHQKYKERNFVLIPLSEIEPDFLVENLNILEYIKLKNYKDKVKKVTDW